MATSVGITDVQESMKKETQIRGGQYGSELILDGTARVEQTHVIFKLKDTFRKGRVNIDGIAHLVNPQTKKLEPARLLRGFPSIWQKDQKDLDKEFVNKNRRSLVFEDSVCRIALHDEPALEFARLNPCNTDSKHPEPSMKFAFYEYNSAKIAEEHLKHELAIMDLVKQAATVSEDKMRKHALYLGISFSDDLGVPKSPDGIRAEYMLAAKNRYKDFKNSFDNKIVDISFLVKKAIRDGKIDLQRQKDHAYWTVGGGYIGMIPASQTAVDFLIELGMNPNSPEGKQFLEYLKETVK